MLYYPTYNQVISDSEPYQRTSARKVHFWKILSVTLTFEPMTLKMSPCHTDLMMSNCDKYH